ncbi:MAG: helix-hairpin-helix domain-containing protein [Salinirussus sp.]
MDIEAIPGVGPKTADALRTLDDPEAALRNGDVAAIADAPGISTGRAARIARAAVRDAHDDPGGFAATDRAQELHDIALSLLQERTVTDHAAHRLETLYPTGSRSRIDEVQSFAERAMEREPQPAVQTALTDVAPLETPSDVRVRDRALATANAETYTAAQEAVPELSVELVEDARDLAELARGYATVIALDESFAGVEIDGDVRVEPDVLETPSELVPERPLAFFSENRESIQAAIEVHRVADLDAPTDLEALDEALSRLDEDGMPQGDAELMRLESAVEDLDDAVGVAESVADDRLREAIAERDVTIEGDDLLSLVERGAGADSLLRRELADEFDEAIAAARDHLIDALELEEHADEARRVFGGDPTFPVARDEAALSRLRESLSAARNRRAAVLKRELAERLADQRSAAETMVAAALELDVELAVARFVADFDCTMPEFGGEGVTIENGRSPLLEVEDIEAVDYEVNGVRLLSGVNSGGKTSLLDLVGLVVTLAHMGLPVPADQARLERIDELHYHAAGEGTLDAGAFEATLRAFGELVTEVSADREVLVLVDELESITEPGAAATILAGILEALSERGATAVFVSHLAREIREAASVDIAVDGIQAQGLEDGELLVDRSPVPGRLARSTPELIVEKLAGEDTSGFYAKLLKKF